MIIESHIADYPLDGGDPPKLLLAQSTVYHCNGCGRWVCRVPKFMDDMRDWQCDECGCTSVRMRDGRPFGPKSRQWNDVVTWFNHCYPLHEMDMQFVTVQREESDNG